MTFFRPGGGEGDVLDEVPPFFPRHRLPFPSFFLPQVVKKFAAPRLAKMLQKFRNFTLLLFYFALRNVLTVD